MMPSRFLGRGAAGLAVSLALTGAALADPIDILFVGNSFTHGNNQPAMSYNNGSITDANGTGYGGVPGIFKQLTMMEGLSYNVTIEAVSSQTLEWHYENKASIIGQPWDIVVLQEQSTTPLPSNHGGDPGLFATGVSNLKNLILSQNSAASIYLYETWASPTSVTNQGYTNSGGLQAMQNDLQAATYQTYYNTSGLTGVARVGDAFLRAIDQGVADPNPSDGISAGTIDLWSAADNRHASAYGSYLAAAVMYAKITGADPRSLSVGTGSAAEGLGLSATAAESLNRIAYETTALAEPTPAPTTVNTRNPATAASFSGLVTAGSPARIAGNAVLASLTTAEGTFTNLQGATANSVVTSNSLNVLGTTPDSAAAAVSGLTVNDGVNNLQSANFQFAQPITTDTRFFILESAPTSSAVGDAATITLLDAANNVVGTFMLSLSVSDFTNSGANNTADALGLITYTSGQGTLTAKLGAATFSLADFSGTGDPSTVTGLRIASTTIDPNVVGAYSVPEPATWALLGVGALGYLVKRRGLSLG